MTKTITTVPAQPGFDVVVLCHAQPPYLIYSPVVAWTVCVHSEHYSTAAAVCWGTNQYPDDVETAIRQPDGTIMFSDGPTFAKGQEAEALEYAVMNARPALQGEQPCS